AVFAVFCSKISAKCRLSASDSLGFRSACVSGKQQRTWLFLAVFERARPAADRNRKCMAAGDYQFDSEIASRNSYLSNYLEGRSGASPVSLPRFKRRLRVEFGGPASHAHAVKAVVRHESHATKTRRC